jgi:hypothetical protein
MDGSIFWHCKLTPMEFPGLILVTDLNVVWRMLALMVEITR